MGRLLLIFHILTTVIAVNALAVFATHVPIRKTFAIAFLAVALGTPTALVLRMINESNRSFSLYFLSGIHYLKCILFRVMAPSARTILATLPIPKALAVHF